MAPVDRLVKGRPEKPAEGMEMDTQGDVMNGKLAGTRAQSLSTISLTALAVMIALSGAGQAAAQEPASSGAQTAPQTGPQTAPQANSAPAAIGEIVVSGFRQAYSNAVITKRNSVEITDSISSDGLGRFPDLNVGEAIQRIPGVQLNREADSRNATISLRGLVHPEHPRATRVGRHLCQRHGVRGVRRTDDDHHV
jgi:hypothetical protein